MKDYHRINQRLLRNLYPFTSIDNNLQQLEGFQYATAIYLNLGNYTIKLPPAIQDIMMIVTGSGKFRYSLPLMGMCASGYIF